MNMVRSLVPSALVCFLLCGNAETIRAELLPPFDLERLVSHSGLIVHVKLLSATKVKLIDIIRGKCRDRELIVPALKFDGPIAHKFPESEPEMILFLYGGIKPSLGLQSHGVVLFSKDGTKVYFLTVPDYGHFDYVHQPKEGSRDDFLKKLKAKAEAEAEARKKTRSEDIKALDVLPLVLPGTPGYYDKLEKVKILIEKIAQSTLPGDMDGIDAIIRRRNFHVPHALKQINDSDAPTKLYAAWGDDITRYEAASYLAETLGAPITDSLLTADTFTNGILSDNVNAMLILLERKDTPETNKAKLAEAVISAMNNFGVRICFRSLEAFKVTDRRILAAMEQARDAPPQDSGWGDWKHGVELAKARLYRIEHGIESLKLEDLEKLEADPSPIRGLHMTEMEKRWGRPDVKYTSEHMYWSVNMPFVNVFFKNDLVDSIQLVPR